jgi:arginine/lysine/histidine/glutamine transport system substrate-binding and permease protein
MIDGRLLLQSLPTLFSGVLVTLQLAIFSCCIGVIGGVILAFSYDSSTVAVRWFVRGYTTIIRGTPMFTQILFFFNVLPYVGWPIPAFWIAVIAIGLNSACYISHIVRAGIASVSTGQKEAARVLGFSPFQISWYIVLPQAIRSALPSLGNELITLVKDSSLASAIGVPELSRQGSFIVSRTYDVITIFAVIALTYLAMTSLIAAMISYLERKMVHHA